jgi:hypothetical protein
MEIMKEYFVKANSFAAPFFSDSSEVYVKGENPKKAMEKFVKEYTHPCGLYAANLYENADAYHKKRKILVEYRSNEAEFMQKVGGTSIYKEKAGRIQIDGIWYDIPKPTEGSIVKRVKGGLK